MSIRITMIKKLFALFLCMSTYMVVLAQFPSSSRIYLYVKSDISPNDARTVYAVKFQYDIALFGEIRINKTPYEDLQERPNRFDEMPGYGLTHTITYNDDLSSTRRTTYTYHRNSTTWCGIYYPAYDQHYSFSPDKSSMIIVNDDGSKVYFTRVTTDDFKPKALNKDFMYE